MTNKHAEAANPRSASGSPGLHLYARALAAATFVLIFAGGLVTSTGSALAVPDWPLSFGKFFPRMEGGVLYEHGHRMIAGTVAIMTLLMAIWAWRREERRFVRNLALFAFALVIVQAVLGGLTVLLLLPLAIAVSHAATAQAFFCLTVALALFTNPQWRTVPRVEPAAQWPHLPVLAAVTTAVIYLQILVGALMRHMGAGLAIPDFPLSFGHLLPPVWNAHIAIHFAHRAGAAAVTLLVLATAGLVRFHHRCRRGLVRTADALVGFVALQIALGAFVIWSGKDVMVNTAHVVNGALVLGTSVVLTLRCWRAAFETSPAGSPAPERPDPAAPPMRSLNEARS